MAGKPRGPYPERDAVRYDHIHNVKEMRRLERDRWKVTCRCDWTATAPDPMAARADHNVHVFDEHERDIHGAA